MTLFRTDDPLRDFQEYDSNLQSQRFVRRCCECKEEIEDHEMWWKIGKYYYCTFCMEEHERKD